jgi:hypothetical protein
MSTPDPDGAWRKAWAPLTPPKTDHLVPTRRSLFDAGRVVGFAEGYYAATGGLPHAEEKP